MVNVGEHETPIRRQDVVYNSFEIRGGEQPHSQQYYANLYHELDKSGVLERVVLNTGEDGTEQFQPEQAIDFVKEQVVSGPLGSEIKGAEADLLAITMIAADLARIPSTDLDEQDREWKAQFFEKANKVLMKVYGLDKRKLRKYKGVIENIIAGKELASSTIHIKDLQILKYLSHLALLRYVGDAFIDENGGIVHLSQIFEQAETALSKACKGCRKSLEVDLTAADSGSDSGSTARNVELVMLYRPRKNSLPTWRGVYGVGEETSFPDSRDEAYALTYKSEIKRTIKRQDVEFEVLHMVPDVNPLEKAVIRNWAGGWLSRLRTSIATESGQKPIAILTEVNQRDPAKNIDRHEGTLTIASHKALTYSLSENGEIEDINFHGSFPNIEDFSLTELRALIDGSLKKDAPFRRQELLQILTSQLRPRVYGVKAEAILQMLDTKDYAMQEVLYDLLEHYYVSFAQSEQESTREVELIRLNRLRALAAKFNELLGEEESSLSESDKRLIKRLYKAVLQEQLAHTHKMSLEKAFSEVGEDVRLNIIRNQEDVEKLPLNAQRMALEMLRKNGYVLYAEREGDRGLEVEIFLPPRLNRDLKNPFSVVFRQRQGTTKGTIWDAYFRTSWFVSNKKTQGRFYEEQSLAEFIRRNMRESENYSIIASQNRILYALGRRMNVTTKQAERLLSKVHLDDDEQHMLWDVVYSRGIKQEQQEKKFERSMAYAQRRIELGLSGIRRKLETVSGSYELLRDYLRYGEVRSAISKKEAVLIIARLAYAMRIAERLRNKGELADPAEIFRTIDRDLIYDDSVAKEILIGRNWSFAIPFQGHILDLLEGAGIIPEGFISIDSLDPSQLFVKFKNRFFADKGESKSKWRSQLRVHLKVMDQLLPVTPVLRDALLTENTKVFDENMSQLFKRLQLNNFISYEQLIQKYSENQQNQKKLREIFKTLMPQAWYQFFTTAMESNGDIEQARMLAVRSLLENLVNSWLNYSLNQKIRGYDSSSRRERRTIMLEAEETLRNDPLLRAILGINDSEQNIPQRSNFNKFNKFKKFIKEITNFSFKNGRPPLVRIALRKTNDGMIMLEPYINVARGRVTAPKLKAFEPLTQKLNNILGLWKRRPEDEQEKDTFREYGAKKWLSRLIKGLLPIIVVGILINSIGVGRIQRFYTAARSYYHAVQTVPTPTSYVASPKYLYSGATITEGNSQSNVASDDYEFISSGRSALQSVDDGTEENSKEVIGITPEALSSMRLSSIIKGDYEDVPKPIIDWLNSGITRVEKENPSLLKNYPDQCVALVASVQGALGIEPKYWIVTNSRYAYNAIPSSVLKKFLSNPNLYYAGAQGINVWRLQGINTDYINKALKPGSVLIAYDGPNVPGHTAIIPYVKDNGDGTITFALADANYGDSGQIRWQEYTINSKDIDKIKTLIGDFMGRKAGNVFILRRANDAIYNNLIEPPHIIEEVEGGKGQTNQDVSFNSNGENIDSQRKEEADEGHIGNNVQTQTLGVENGQGGISVADSQSQEYDYSSLEKMFFGLLETFNQNSSEVKFHIGPEIPRNGSYSVGVVVVDYVAGRDTVGVMYDVPVDNARAYQPNNEAAGLAYTEGAIIGHNDLNVSISIKGSGNVDVQSVNRDTKIPFSNGQDTINMALWPWDRHGHSKEYQLGHLAAALGNPDNLIIINYKLLNEITGHAFSPWTNEQGGIVLNSDDFPNVKAYLDELSKKYGEDYVYGQFNVFNKDNPVTPRELQEKIRHFMRHGEGAMTTRREGLFKAIVLDLLRYGVKHPKYIMDLVKYILKIINEETLVQVYAKSGNGIYRPRVVTVPANVLDLLENTIKR